MKPKNNRIYLLTLLVIAVFFTSPMKAQVNIGSQDDPRSFSILELTTMNKLGGLRMPQLNNKERDAVQTEFNANSETAEAAKGLVIYNTDTDCMEFWNGKEWIGLCSDALPPPPPTVVPEENPTLTENGNIRITTYINMMYDFQHQTLTAYLTTGAATAYQWQMSKDGATWYDISGAKSADYVVPADFMYKLGDLGLDKDNTNISSPGNNSLEIRFRCQITNSGATANTTSANILSMLFIRTNTAGYGIDPTTGVRYLTIKRGVGGDPYGGTIKIALLNLGQSGTGAWINGVHKPDNGELNDAGDLGDMYQWGRVADGQEHVVWSKNTSVATNNTAYMQNIITPLGSGSGFTSDIIAKDADQQSYTTSPTVGQIQEGTYGYGKFITTPSTYPDYNDWGEGGTASNSRWGNGTYYERTTVPANLSGWTTPANNPCPGNWYIPSWFDFGDIYRSKGNTTPLTMNATPFTSNANNSNDWTFRAISSPTNSTGGAIITNPSTGEQVFVPITGYRDFSNGTIATVNGNMTSSYCWSSTTYAPEGGFMSAVNLYAANNPMDNLYLGSGRYPYGVSVRCIAE